LGNEPKKKGLIVPFLQSFLNGFLELLGFILVFSLQDFHFPLKFFQFGLIGLLPIISFLSNEKIPVTYPSSLPVSVSLFAQSKKSPDFKKIDAYFAKMVAD